MRYDCIIIGSGPAGLSAAVNLKIYKKNYLWFGNSNLSDKVRKAEKIHNYPGLSGITGTEFGDRLWAHKEDMGLELTDKIVSTVYNMGGYYNVMAENQFYETSTVILATGVAAVNPYPGETEFLGRGVSYCATCDGMLYKEKEIAVIATSKRFEHEIGYLAGLAKTVYLFPFYKDCTVEGDNIVKMTGRPAEITGGFRVDTLHLAGEEELKVNGIFILRNSIAPDTMLSGLALEEGHMVVNRKMETNFPGIFAAGDCTGKPYQYAKAVGEGNVAAHSVIEYLG